MSKINPVPVLSDKAYDSIKYFAQIVLPAIGALYFGLAQIWGLPKANEVVGTLVVIDTFLGVLLQLSSAKYKASDERFDGEVEVTAEEVEVVIDDEALQEQNEILLEVNAEPDKPVRAEPRKRATRKKV